jgi:hypothetical protein
MAMNRVPSISTGNRKPYTLEIYEPGSTDEARVLESDVPFARIDVGDLLVDSEKAGSERGALLRVVSVAHMFFGDDGHIKHQVRLHTEIEDDRDEAFHPDR